ncbi:MAG: MerR family transcriptional regulator [Parvularculaceae bacterium]|nr:MerR family transcriptional regulator [Parvularculaceae bacterium]
MPVTKAADAFRTISEAAAEVDAPQHVLRHWEEVFGQIRPMRRAGGRRYYRSFDIDVLRGVKALLYDERYTTKGVQKIFRDHGVKYVAEIGRMVAAGQPFERRPLLDEETDDRAAPPPRNPFAERRVATAAPATGAGDLSPALRETLSALLQRLERAQEALDEATLAIEAIDSEE